MKTQDLRDLTLAIVTGAKRDATQIEHNVAASYVRELLQSDAELLDALYANDDLHTVVKVFEGEVFVLAADRSTFYAFDSNEGEPWIVENTGWLEEALLEKLDDADARIVTLEEAMTMDPHAVPHL
jgi:hypothetical protein